MNDPLDNLGKPSANSQVISLRPVMQLASPPPTLKLTPSPEPSLAKRKGADFWLARFLTQDPAMLEEKRKLLLLVNRSEPVLITGPTGTGKELFARALHGERTGQFITVNCGGFPKELVDSMLFGHKRGSFTGAENEHSGLFAAARDGTIFLDEIGELPLLMQAKLLRVIQEKCFTRVGDSLTIETNARVVCATNRDVCKMIQAGTFREDLYWRISTFELKTSSLSDRPEDACMFVRARYPQLAGDHLWLAAVRAYRWSGNYRELEQHCLRKIVFSKTKL